MESGVLFIAYLILAAFIAISIRLVASGVVKLVVPVSIVLGKFIWLDTESIEDIKKLVKTEHKRIIETAILLVLGVLILSILVDWFNMPRYMHPLIVNNLGANEPLVRCA